MVADEPAEVDFQIFWDQEEPTAVMARELLVTLQEFSKMEESGEFLIIETA